MRTSLIVDDSPTVRRVVRQILEGLGFEVVEAEHGMAAVVCCRERWPDLVLLDWRMPVMDGLECLRTLRAMPGGDRPVIVFCTTVNELARIREALDAGADEYIMKPFDEDIVRDKLAQSGVL